MEKPLKQPSQKMAVGFTLYVIQHTWTQDEYEPDTVV